MFQYPNIDPVVFKITDTLQVRWYGLMYIVGFVLAWVLLRYRTKSKPGWESSETLNDLFFFAALGVLVGGRLGYVLFYDLPDLWRHPFNILKIWQGGMSFHGGLIGVVLALWWFAHHKKWSFVEICDLVGPVVPLGLGAGRIGNFINGELWGRPTDAPWGFVFPHVDNLPRHPSQLYAVGLEGILLFVVVWLYSSKPRPAGNVSAVFLIGYAFIRMFEEFFRQPDSQYGYLAFGWLTMGQILCVPMIIFGLLFLKYKPKN